MLPLHALEMAAWGADRDPARVKHHPDHGSNYMSIAYSERVSELSAMPSAGTVGDCQDNTLAETINGLYKAELIRRHGPQRTVEGVEPAALKYVWQWNNRHLHEVHGYQTPIKTKENYYAMNDQPVIAEH